MRQMLASSPLTVVLEGRMNICTSQKVWKHPGPEFGELQEVPGGGASGRGVSGGQRDEGEGETEIRPSAAGGGSVGRNVGRGKGQPLADSQRVPWCWKHREPNGKAAEVRLKAHPCAEPPTRSTHLPTPWFQPHKPQAETQLSFLDLWPTATVG